MLIRLPMLCTNGWAGRGLCALISPRVLRQSLESLRVNSCLFLLALRVVSSLRSLNTPEGRIVDDTEFESASAAKIQDFFDQALDKAARGVAGAFASRGAKKHVAQPAKVIVSTLEGDSDVGGAFKQLQSEGKVVVVASTNHLPERIRKALDQVKASNGVVVKHCATARFYGLHLRHAVGTWHWRL